jgi:hypothetical protein
LITAIAPCVYKVPAAKQDEIEFRSLEGVVQGGRRACPYHQSESECGSPSLAHLAGDDIHDVMAGPVPAIHVFFNSVLILRRTVRSVSKEDSVFSGTSFETPANAGSSG